MKKCVVCHKEIPEGRKNTCETCSDFFTWKYGNKSEERIFPFFELKKGRPYKSKTVRRFK